MICGATFTSVYTVYLDRDVTSQSVISINYYTLWIPGQIIKRIMNKVSYN